MAVKNAEKRPVASVTRCNGEAKYAQDADGTVTITLTGRIAANLHGAADALNAMPWSCGDDTAVNLLAEFVLYDTVKGWGRLSADATGEIVETIDTGAKGKEERERKAQLRAAFAALRTATDGKGAA